MSRAVKIGDVVADKYRVERILGMGGMGMVVAARHLALDQVVALKFMRSAVIGVGGEAAQRFQREARAVAQLRSENVARVMDVGSLPNGTLYMVMEYLDGVDLASVIEHHGALACEDAVDYVLHVCAGLAEAHKQGIVHRDLKPANLFLTRRPSGAPLIKVLDFGVSKYRPASGEVPRFETSTTGIMGSPPFMSPEQAQSARDADQRSDIWSLGVILYYLLSGKLPFDAESNAEIFAMILCDPPPRLCDRAPWVPPGLEAVVTHCLEKEPEKRFERVTLLAAALTPFASARGRALVDASQIPVSSAIPALLPADFDPSQRDLFGGPTGPITTPKRLDVDALVTELRGGDATTGPTTGTTDGATDGEAFSSTTFSNTQPGPHSPSPSSGAFVADELSSAESNQLGLAETVAVEALGPRPARDAATDPSSAHAAAIDDDDDATAIEPGSDFDVAPTVMRDDTVEDGYFEPLSTDERTTIKPTSVRDFDVSPTNIAASLNRDTEIEPETIDNNAEVVWSDNQAAQSQGLELGALPAVAGAVQESPKTPGAPGSPPVSAPRGPANPGHAPQHPGPRHPYLQTPPTGLVHRHAPPTERRPVVLVGAIAAIIAVIIGIVLAVWLQNAP